MSVDPLIMYMHHSYEAEKRLDEKVDGLVKKIESHINQMKSERNVIFSQQLLAYLRVRKTQIVLFSHDILQIYERAQYIEKLTKALLNKDAEVMKMMLTEKRIESFKGFFSKRLYNLLASYRDAKEIEMEVNPIHSIKHK